MSDGRVRWLELTVTLEEAEVVADELFGAGAVAVEERRGVGAVVLVTSFASLAEHEAARRRFSARYQVDDLAGDDTYLDAWRAFAEPVRVGRHLVVVPAWQALAVARDDVVVRIDPGRAFGSGAHATTRLVLAAVERLVVPGCSVLDVGCGSGVLGIAAARLGAGRVVGVDVERDAVEATVTNARVNGVSVAAGEWGVDEVPGPFDLVLANVLAPVLVELAPGLVAALAPSGALVVSGLLAERAAHVLDALAPLLVVRDEVLDGWLALTLRLP